MTKYIFTLITALFLTTTFGQKVKPTSTNDFVMECMRTHGEGINKQMVIWFPYNFWEIIGEQMKVSPEFVENITTQMKDYMMFCVVDYTTTSSGITFKTEEEIRKDIKFIDSSKNVLKPLEDEEISSDANQLLQILRPTMAQMLGQFGDGMRIFLFNAKKVNGKPSFNVLAKNKFTLSWNTTNLNWSLPLSSVLPPIFCPIDNEQMKGNWMYCPIHGIKLNK